MTECLTQRPKGGPLSSPLSHLPPVTYNLLMRTTTRIPGVIIRQMRIEDYDQVSSLWHGAREVRVYTSDSRKSIERFLVMNQESCFVADTEGQVVGTILGGFDGRRAYIYHLVVEGEQRGRNIGSALLEKTITALKAKGVDKAHIFVPIYNNRHSLAFTGARIGTGSLPPCG